MVAQLSRSALGVTVAPMRHGDIGAVVDIERRCYPTPWKASLFAHELSQPGRCYLVALGPRPRSWWRRRRVVGYAGFLMQAGEAHITTVAVEPGQHRRKVATHLLVELLTQARAMGAVAATLEVRSANEGAQRLYERFGFRTVGMRPRYYAETHEDAVIMSTDDLRSSDTVRLLDEQRGRLGAPGGASGDADLHVPWVQGRRGLDG
jgi:[ribosomal protein S18]-alanine N-acetyltransferase